MQKTFLLVVSGLVIFLVGVLVAPRLNLSPLDSSTSPVEANSVPTWTPTPGLTPIPTLEITTPAPIPTANPSTLTSDAYFDESERHIEFLVTWITEYEELSRLPITASSRWEESEPEWRRRMIALTNRFQTFVREYSALRPPSHFVDQHDAIVEAFEICNASILEIKAELEDPNSTKEIFPISTKCNIAFMDLISYLEERSLLGD
ncbi:MAG: hypothetical protein KF753_20300 [Caldilineaceae bacterium]|nr:hypothetical protein [Caldilineaceae bacterium]